MLDDKNPYDLDSDPYALDSDPYDLDSDSYALDKFDLDRKEISDKCSKALILLLSEKRFENQISTDLAQKFNVNTNLYDKVIDSIYNKTKIGGPTLHHNLDGAHTFEGALNVLRQNFPNDSDFKLVLESINHLAKDLTTPSGINPFLNPHDFLATKSYLTDYFYMSDSSANDLLNINAEELGGMIIASIAMVYNLRSNQIDKMGEYFSRLSLVSLIAGNPAMLFLSFIIMGQSFIQLLKHKEFIKFFDGAASGILSTASFYYATASLSGPLFPILLIGLASSIGANWLYKNAKNILTDDLDDTFARIFPAYKSYFKMI